MEATSIVTTWYAGTATREITPPAGSLMACFPTGPDRTPRRATGAHDPILAKALVLSDGRETIALCALDVAMINTSDVASIRRAVVDAVPGFDGANVLIAATHTHSSPESTYQFGGAPDDPWMAELRRAVIDLVREAHGRLEPARVGVGTGSADLTFNRRIVTDGQAKNVHSEPPEGGQGPTDPEVGVLRVDRADGRPLAVVVNYAAHPLVIGPGSFVYSADFPGSMRDHLESAIGEGVEAIFVNGAAGDIHPKTAITLDWDEVERMGTRLGEAALSVYAATATDAEPRISYEHDLMSFPSRVAERLRVEVDVGLLRIGDAAIAVVPGEFFVSHQLAFKRGSRATPALFIGYANDSIGYVPDLAAYPLGGYGVDLFHRDPPALNRTRMPPGSGEAIVERLIAMANRA